MKLKFYKENIGMAICMGISIIIFFPFVAFLSPSVSEMMNPALNECNVYYEDVYIPCMTASEVYKTNLILSAIISLIMMIWICFIPANQFKQELE